MTPPVATSSPVETPATGATTLITCHAVLRAKLNGIAASPAQQLELARQLVRRAGDGASDVESGTGL